MKSKKMSEAILRELTETIEIVNDYVVLKALKYPISVLATIFSMDKPREYSLMKTIPKCRCVDQVELLLFHRQFAIRRKHNKLLISVSNIEILEYLLNHHTCRFNPGYRSSLPLYEAVMENNHEKVRLFLSTRKCNIHARPEGLSILQHAIALNNELVLKSFALLYSRDTGVFDGLTSYDGYTSNELVSIDALMNDVRARMCLEQMEAKEAFLEIIATKRCSLDEYLRIAQEYDILAKLRNDELYSTREDYKRFVTNAILFVNNVSLT